VKDSASSSGRPTIRVGPSATRNKPALPSTPRSRRSIAVRPQPRGAVDALAPERLASAILHPPPSQPPLAGSPTALFPVSPFGLPAVLDVEDHELPRRWLGALPLRSMLPETPDPERRSGGGAAVGHRQWSAAARAPVELISHPRSPPGASHFRTSPGDGAAAAGPAGSLEAKIRTVLLRPEVNGLRRLGGRAPRTTTPGPWEAGVMPWVREGPGSAL
jgi:hypothetical protein